MSDKQLHDYYELYNQLKAYREITFESKKESKIDISIVNDYRFKVERMQRDVEYEILKYSIESLKPDAVTEPINLKLMEDLRSMIMELWI